VRVAGNVACIGDMMNTNSVTDIALREGVIWETFGDLIILKLILKELGGDNVDWIH
jgi:hypothetical protein